MNRIYRFTGPPENWITGIGLRKWAVNENNKGLWEKFNSGDIALLHSTAKSGYSNKTPSSVIGYAVIGSKKWEKNEQWWMQEKQSGSNLWPYVFTIDELYLFKKDLDIDFMTDNTEKNPEQIKREVEKLGNSGYPITRLNELAKQKDPNAPAFPVNGSASGVNYIYEDILLSANEDLFQYGGDLDTAKVEERLSEIIDDTLYNENLEQIINQAKSFDASGRGYIEKNGVYRLRKDNETQKRRIAKIENYTCQVCGFYCEYKRANGKTGHIIQVDHILDKNLGGTEEINNLWVLCPNCHSKKTRNVITINTDEKIVKENGIKIEITDKHLWLEQYNEI